MAKRVWTVAQQACRMAGYCIYSIGSEQCSLCGTTKEEARRAAV